MGVAYRRCSAGRGCVRLMLPRFHYRDGVVLTVIAAGPRGCHGGTEYSVECCCDAVGRTPSAMQIQRTADLGIVCGMNTESA